MLVRRVVGPILTTGVALAASAVVVANPIVSTRADVQIPAVALSAGSGDPTSMLDQEFLDAIAPAEPESTSPFSVLKQLITSLAADATHLGKNAIVGAFVAGVTAVSSDPELTASSTPYLPPSSSSLLGESPAVIASVLPGLDMPAVTAAVSAVSDFAAKPALPELPDLSAVSGIAPAVTSLVSGLVDDVGYVGKEVVAAAFAAGAVVAAQPGLIVDTVVALAKGDVKGALTKAITVVTSSLGPPTIVVNALRTVVENRFAELSGVVVTPVTPGSTATVDTSAAEPVAPVRVDRAALPEVTVSKPSEPSAADFSAATSRSEARVVDDSAAPARRAAGRTRDAVKSVGDTVSAAVSNAAAAVGSVADRAGRRGAPAADVSD